MLSPPKRRVATPVPTLAGPWVVDFKWADDGLQTQLVTLRETRRAGDDESNIGGVRTKKELDNTRWAYGLRVMGTRRGEVAYLVVGSDGDFEDMGVDLVLGRDRRTWSGWWHIGATYSQGTREGRVEFRRPPIS